jgi:antitoxin ParD1/3/4
MNTVDLEIPEALRPFVEGQVASRGYRDAAEYFLSLAEADRLRDIRVGLEAKLLEAIQSPSTPMTSQDWHELRRAGTEAIRKRATA